MIGARCRGPTDCESRLTLVARSSADNAPLSDRLQVCLPLNVGKNQGQQQHNHAEISTQNAYKQHVQHRRPFPQALLNIPAQRGWTTVHLASASV